MRPWCLTCFVPTTTPPPVGLERPLSVRIVPSESRAERESFGSNRYEPYGKVPYHRWPPGPTGVGLFGAVLGSSWCHWLMLALGGCCQAISYLFVVGSQLVSTSLL